MSNNPTVSPLVGSAAPTKAATMEDNSQPSYRSPTAASTAKSAEKKSPTLKEQRALHAAKQGKPLETVRTIKVPVPHETTTLKPQPAASKRSTPTFTASTTAEKPKPATKTTKAPAARKILVKNAPKPVMKTVRPAVKENFHPFGEVTLKPIPQSQSSAAPVIQKSMTLKEQAAAYAAKGKVIAQTVRVVKEKVKATTSTDEKSHTSGTQQPSSKKEDHFPTPPSASVKNAPKPKPPKKDNVRPSGASKPAAKEKYFHPFGEVTLKLISQPQPQPSAAPVTEKKSLTLKQQMAAYKAQGKVLPQVVRVVHADEASQPLQDKGQRLSMSSASSSGSGSARNTPFSAAGNSRHTSVESSSSRQTAASKTSNTSAGWKESSIYRITKPASRTKRNLPDHKYEYESEPELEPELEEERLKELHPALMSKEEKTKARKIAAAKLKMAAAMRAEKKNSTSPDPGPAPVANMDADMEVAAPGPVAPVTDMDVDVEISGPRGPAPVPNMEVVVAEAGPVPMADMMTVDEADTTTVEEAPLSGKKRSRDEADEDDDNVKDRQEEEGSPRDNKRAKHC